MISRFFSVRIHTAGEDLILFLIRLVVGLAFLHHGWQKIQTPISWMGPGAIFPGFLQFFAAISEFGGAISWILGFLTRLGAFGIGCTMFVAVCVHRFIMGDPFVNLTGGRSYELAAAYLFIALFLLVAGPGKFSLDRKLFGIAPS